MRGHVPADDLYLGSFGVHLENLAIGKRAGVARLDLDAVLRLRPRAGIEERRAAQVGLARMDASMEERAPIEVAHAERMRTNAQIERERVLLQEFEGLRIRLERIDRASGPFPRGKQREGADVRADVEHAGRLHELQRDLVFTAPADHAHIAIDVGGTFEDAAICFFDAHGASLPPMLWADVYRELLAAKRGETVTVPRTAIGSPLAAGAEASRGLGLGAHYRFAPDARC